MTDTKKQDQSGKQAREPRLFARTRRLLDKIPHSYRNYLTALLIMGVIGTWMASDNSIFASGNKQTSVSKTAQKNTAGSSVTSPEKARMFTVQIRTSKARTRQTTLKIKGRTEADVRVDVRAETHGRVIELPVKKGAFVLKDKVLCRIDPGARKVTLDQARAQLAQTNADLNATKKLMRRGYAPKLRQAEQKAKRDGAIASVRLAELDLQRTAIKAPFSGLVEEQQAKVGDYLAVGGICARLVSLNPLIVAGQVSERDISALRLNMVGKISIVTGEKIDGKIRYISPSAEAKTRTFRVEFEVPNRNNLIRSGLTATIELPLSPVQGHLFSAGLLTLDKDGNVGVRTIEDNAIVRFRRVQILHQGKKGVWVDGLPAQVTLITGGQDYVVEGQKVKTRIDPQQTANGGAKETKDGSS